MSSNKRFTLWKWTFCISKLDFTECTQPVETDNVPNRPIYMKFSSSNDKYLL